MKYLITLKDSNIHVEPAEKPAWWHGDTTLRALPETGQAFFEHHEYLTVEFDDQTGQMRVWHPNESQPIDARTAPQPFSVYRKYIKSMNWREDKSYQVSIYSDGHNTCECAAWFFFDKQCKHITAILENAPFYGQVWEKLQHDDREDFKESQSRLYDTRSENSDGEST